MIQPALFFALGALSVALVALLAAPGFRRSAERAAKRRLEAGMPMSMNEIEAGKDALRAEFAAATARFEQDARTLRDKHNEQAVAAGRAQEETRLLQNERDELLRAVARLEGEGAELRAALAGERESGRDRDERLAVRDRQLAEAKAELDRVGRSLEETTYLASSRQIDLVARESALERLNGELEEARTTIERRDGELAAARETLEAEAQRERDSKDRADALTSELFAAEQRIERNRHGAERLRKDGEAGEAERRRMAEELLDARRERMGLELEFAALNRQLAALFPGSVPGGDPATGLKAAAAERDRLEARLASLQRENRDLRAAGAPPAAALREQMLEMAAQVTALVARLEGPGGPVDAALAAEGLPGEGPQPSLAARIRALRAQVQNKAPPRPDRW